MKIALFRIFDEIVGIFLGSVFQKIRVFAIRTIFERYYIKYQKTIGFLLVCIDQNERIDRE